MLPLINRLAAIGHICTRRRLKCAAKVLLCASLLAAYVSVLLRESLQAMEQTKRKADADLRMTVVDAAELQVSGGLGMQRLRMRTITCMCVYDF